MTGTIDAERNVVHEPARDVPVMAEADVLVVGGSATGVAAAVAAARNGVDVLLIERYGFLGGQMTAGLVCSPHCPLPCSEGEEGQLPIFVEMLRRAVDASGRGHTWRDVEDDPLTDVMLNPEVAKHVLQEMVAEAGVRLLLHTAAADAVLADGAIRGVIVESKAGRSALLAKVVIDATGDGDVAARAGAPFTQRPAAERMTIGMLTLACGVDIDKTLAYLEQSPAEYTGPIPLVDLAKRAREDRPTIRGFLGFGDLVRQAAEKGDFIPAEGACFYWLGRGIAMISGTPYPQDMPPIDAMDPEDMTRGELLLRSHAWRKACFFRDYVPGFEGSSLIATGVHAGVRETRSLVTEHVLTGEDGTTSRTFDDTIFQIPNVSGVHLYHFVTNHPKDLKAAGLEKVLGDLSIPYRLLLPKKVENLLVAGRCVAYMIGAGALCGQAAGTAAAMAVQAGTTPRKLDVPALQEKLTAQGLTYATIGP